jgi:hypothetical protein
MVDLSVHAHKHIYLKQPCMHACRRHLGIVQQKTGRISIKVWHWTVKMEGSLFINCSSIYAIYVENQFPGVFEKKEGESFPLSPNNSSALRGLRQGDPLSLMLSLLVINTLRLLTKAIEFGILRCLARRELTTFVSLYADDVAIFCHPQNAIFHIC